MDEDGVGGAGEAVDGVGPLLRSARGPVGTF